MKKKILIVIAVIGVILTGFQFNIYAEENTQNNSESITFAYGDLSELDDYFYSNFTLLPYIESTDNQYINTGVNASNKLIIDYSFSNLSSNLNFCGLMGFTGSGSDLYDGYLLSSDGFSFRFSNASYFYTYFLDSYSIYHIKRDCNNVYFNSNLIYSFNDSDFTGGNIFIFGLNNGSNIVSKSLFRLYYFSIYDTSLNNNNEEIGLIRSFYPAKSNANGDIGLYDSVSKTFYVSNSGTPFSMPNGSSTSLSLSAHILRFLTSSLSSIGEILSFVIETPIILFFLAIGLAGAMYRWARKLVHF